MQPLRGLAVAQWKLESRDVSTAAKCESNLWQLLQDLDMLRHHLGLDLRSNRSRNIQKIGLRLRQVCYTFDAFVLRSVVICATCRTVARQSSIGGLYVCARGGLRSCRGAGGAWHSNLTKLPLIYSVSYFDLGGGLEAVFGGAKPTKAPPLRRDCTWL